MKQQLINRCLKKITYGITTLIVSLVLVFLPMSHYTGPQVAEAGGLSGGATEFTQKLNNTLLGSSLVQQTIVAGSTSVTAANTTADFLKNNFLDGIAWTIAKTMLSSMVRSLINWVNSGFQGSPAFVTDLKQTLLDAVDQAAGEFIRSLGDVGEFICSPFKLDVQAALAINYSQARTGMPSGPDKNLCRISDIGSNIENFFSGIENDWNTWFQVTSNAQNTPVGAYLEAEAKLNAKLINERGNTLAEVSWGNGFLSQKLCQAVEGKSTSQCTITTPGRVISEALTFSTSVGPRTLIEADEINELVGALLNQLILQVMQGVNGLLGLGGNSQFTAYDADGRSFLDNMILDIPGLDPTALVERIDQQLEIELEYLTLINEKTTETNTRLQQLERELDRLNTLLQNPEIDDETKNRIASDIQDVQIKIAVIADLLMELTRERLKINANVALLNELREILTEDIRSSDTESLKRKSDAAIRFGDFTQSESITIRARIIQKDREWSEILELTTIGGLLGF